MAQAVIGALRVIIGLDSANFSRGARRAESRSAQLGKALGRISIGAAAAGGAILALARRSGNLIDEQAKLALSLGSTTASIQVLQRAGDLAGVSFGVIEQATIALTRRLSQAATGTGPAIDALKTLGLTVEQLNAVPLDQRIALIQKQLADFVPDAERAAVASALFGDRAGLIFSRIDPATLITAREELEKFNVTVSETDAAQIQATNDAMSRLGLIATGIGNQIAVALAPVLQRLADALTVLTAKGSTFSVVLETLVSNIDTILIALGALASLIAGKLVFSIGSAILGFVGLANPIGLVVGLVAALSAGALILTGRLGEQEQASYDAEAGTAALNAALGTFYSTAAPTAAREAIELANANYQLAASAVDAAKAEIAKQKSLLEIARSSGANGTSGSIRDMGDSESLANGRIAESVNRLVEAQRALEQATSDRTRAVTAVTTASTFSAEVNETLGEGIEVLVDTTTDFGSAAGGAASQVDTLTQAAENLDPALDSVNTRAQSINEGLADVFTDALSGAKSLGEGIRDLVRELAILGLKQSILNGLQGGGGEGGGIGGFLANLIPAFATGTNFAPGGMAMVGERGPELVNLPRGSKVFDANKTASMMGGGGDVSVNPNIINVMDPAVVGDYLNTPMGEKAVLNIMRRNS